MKTILISAALIAVICASFTFIGTTTNLVQSPSIGTPAELCSEVSDPQDRILYEHEVQTNLFIGTARFGVYRTLALFTSRHGGLNPLGMGWRSDDKDHRVTSRQLVGILMHKTPRVYLISGDDEKDAVECQKAGETNGDFRFSEAEIDSRKIKTRELTAFEAHALKLLRSGSKLVTWRTTKHIRAMGAIRAEQACTRCHDEKPGEILGALTYFITVRTDVPLYVRHDKTEMEKLAAIKKFPIVSEAPWKGDTSKFKEDWKIQLNAACQIEMLADAGIVTDAMIAAVREYRDQHEKWVAENEDNKPVRLKREDPPSDK